MRHNSLSVYCVCVTLMIMTMENCYGCYQNHRNLYQSLFGQNYSAKIIPTCKDLKKITVTIDMALNEIVELSEKLQIVRLKIWVRLKWMDCVLRWDPSNFDNETSIVVPYSDIWVPDITLYQGVSDEGNMPDMKEYRALVTSKGDVTYNFPSIITSSCRINVTYFPFDHQVCKLKFGSWIYSSKHIDLSVKRATADLKSYVTHNEWEVVSVKSVKHNIYYGCCPDPYPDVTYYLHMKRQPKFYIVTIMFPCFLVTALTFMGFVLPPMSGEKISLQITVLLSITVFLLLVQDKLPSSSDTFPYIALYFAFSMGLVCVSCILSGIVLYVYYRRPEEHEVPKWAHRIFLHTLRKLVCIKAEQILNNEQSVKIKSIRCLETGKGIPHSECVEKHMGRKSVKNGFVRPSKGDIPEYRDIKKYDLGKGHYSNEWELMAYVLDRFFMVFYVILSITNTLSFVLIMSNYDGINSSLQSA